MKQLLRQVINHGGLNLISTDRPPDSLIPLLKYHRMSSLFADKLTVYDGYPRKPDPAMFNALITRHSLNRAETLAIGDRDLDLAAGKAAGIQYCFVWQCTEQGHP